MPSIAKAECLRNSARPSKNDSNKQKSNNKISVNDWAYISIKIDCFKLQSNKFVIIFKIKFLVLNLTMFIQ